MAHELAANAILHARTPFSVAVSADTGLVRVEVTDEALGLPAIRAFDQGSSSGRGLQIVDSLASRWGVESQGTGKLVWFEQWIR